MSLPLPTPSPLSTPSNPSNPSSPIYPHYPLYPKRWLILLLFSLTTLTNAALWTTFAPISDLSSQYFFSTSSEKTKVNNLALTYQYLYLPGTILGSWFVLKGSLRTAVVFGSVSTSLGSIIRYLSVVTIKDGEGKYWGVFIGQCLCALGQPMFVNSPGLLSSNWFGVSERDLATTIASLFAVIGNAVGQVMPSMVVGSKEDGSVEGMETLLLQQGIMGILCSLGCCIWFGSSPPTPPSSSTFKRDKIRRNGISVGKETEKDEIKEILLKNVEEGRSSASNRKIDGGISGVLSNLLLLFRNPHYMTLFIAFGFGLSLFNAILTVLANILEPCGYTDDDTGNFAATLIGAGLVGAGVTGYLMDKYHIYRELLKLGFLCASITTIILSFSVRSDTDAGLYMSFGMLGFFMIPMLPCMIENAVECTYPLPEELSVGVLFAAGNVLGIGTTILMQYLIDYGGSDACDRWNTPVNLLIMGTAWICSCVVVTFKGPYKRLNAEKEDDDEEEVEGGE